MRHIQILCGNPWPLPDFCAKILAVGRYKAATLCVFKAFVPFYDAHLLSK